MNLKKPLWLCIGLAAYFCTVSDKAEAILASVKSTGMAATAIAYPIDSMAAAYNPAGLVNVEDRLDVGFAWLREKGRARVLNNTAPPSLGINGSFNGFRTNNFYHGEFGINRKMCWDCWEFNVGLVVYNRNFQKTSYSQNLPLFGTSHAGLEFVNETVAPFFAVRLFDCHSLGIAFNWQIERLKVQGLQNFDNALSSVAPGHVTNRGYAYSNGFMPTFGYWGQWTQCVAVGLTYQPKTRMSRFKKYKGFLAGRGRLDVPEKIGAGIAYDYNCFTFCFDWEHIRWSKVRSLSNRLLPALFTSKLGAKNGAGFGFRNQNYYRFGVEWRLTECFTLRAGYRYANTPIRKSQTAVNILTLDLVESFVTVGATWNYSECQEFSAFYAYGIDNSVNGTGAIPPGRPFFGGDVRISERKSALGLGWGWKF